MVVYSHLFCILVKIANRDTLVVVGVEFTCLRVSDDDSTWQVIDIKFVAISTLDVSSELSDLTCTEFLRACNARVFQSTKFNLKIENC